MTVLDNNQVQHKVRLAGIDAPEKAQAFGQNAKNALTRIAFQRDVDVVGHKNDRYGRLIAKIMVADPNCNSPTCPKIHDAGLLLISSGLAWWYKQYEREQTPKDREDYEVAEFNSKAKRIGLWGDKNPTPPWAWRHAK